MIRIAKLANWDSRLRCLNCGRPAQQRLTVVRYDGGALTAIDFCHRCLETVERKAGAPKRKRALKDLLGKPVEARAVNPTKEKQWHIQRTKQHSTPALATHSLSDQSAPPSCRSTSWRKTSR